MSTERPPKQRLYYLAHPYSAPTAAGRVRNANHATLVTARLFEAGYWVYSPLTHSHPINDIIHFSWEQWMAFDKIIMDRCDALILSEGWEKSRGCKEERLYALEKEKPVYLIRDFISV